MVLGSECAFGCSGWSGGEGARAGTLCASLSLATFLAGGSPHQYPSGRALPFAVQGTFRAASVCVRLAVVELLATVIPLSSAHPEPYKKVMSTCLLQVGVILPPWLEVLA